MELGLLNVRGFKLPKNRTEASKMVRKYGLDVLVLTETRVKESGKEIILGEKGNSGLTFYSSGLDGDARRGGGVAHRDSLVSSILIIILIVSWSFW